MKKCGFRLVDGTVCDGEIIDQPGMSKCSKCPNNVIRWRVEDYEAHGYTPNASFVPGVTDRHAATPV